MTRDMKTIYGQDLWNSGAGTLRNCGESFGGRNAVTTFRKNFSHFLHFAAVLLLMLTLGTGSAWGQDTPEGIDRSGYYYIINLTLQGNNTRYNPEEPQNGFYLCPARPADNAGNDYNYDAVYYDGDNKQEPYLTTYKKGRVNDAVWAIEFAETNNHIDYYYIRYCSDNKYLTHNNPIIASDSHRISVHLREGLDGEYSMFCFEAGYHDANCFYIRPRKVTTGNRYLNPTNKNYNQYYGSTDGNKKTKINGKDIYLGGMVGYYNKDDHSDDQASHWYLEKVAPVILYNSSNRIEISYIDESATIYYSYGEDSTPSPSSEGTFIYDGAFNPPTGITTIKAIAIKDGKESGVATFTPPFLFGPTHQYIIQSKQCQFYNLIPNTSIDENTKYVSTLNVPCETMAWHFEYAEEGYYYVVDNSGWYLYYTTTDNSNKYLYLKSSKKDDSDGYKFSIAAYASGGFNIIPKGQTTPVYKANYGSGSVGLTPAKLAGNTSDATSRWDIIPYNAANLPQWADAPFTNVSDDNHTYYYRIVSVNQTAKPIILNNDGAIKSQTIPDGIDERKTMWIIKDAGTSGLLHYYSFENAYTGEKLYYNGNGRNYSNNVLQLGLPSVEGANEQWSHFVIVQTEAGKGYNIIPRPIVDNTKAINTSSNNEAFNCINRRGGNDILGTYYDDGNGSRWTFSQVDFCMPLEFTESEGNITLTCATKGAEIHYTTDGTTPDGTTANVVSESTSWASSGQHRIKAIAVVSDGTNTASSAVVTLLNKPDVTLAAGPYTYKDAAWEPAVTKVSIGESGSETVSSIDPTTYTVSYSADRTNVGTVMVTLENKVEGDMYVWNASTTFDITQKPVTITADSDTKVYNGTALTKSTATATGLVEGHSLASVTVTGTQTAVGESNNVPSAAVIKRVKPM